MWVLLALVLTTGGPAWKALDRFEFRGECERASLAHNRPGEPMHVVTCVWSPNGVVR